jgi:plasmid stability protein
MLKPRIWFDPNAPNGYIDIMSNTQMTSINVRKIPQAHKDRLRVLAAEKGRSVEAEVRDLIAKAVAAQQPPPRNIAKAIMDRFDRIGGVELDIPPRAMPRQIVKFDE